MPKSWQTWDMGSPPSRRTRKRKRSSITELSFHGIHTLQKKAESVTHVSGTNCHLCLGPLKRQLLQRFTALARVERMGRNVSYSDNLNPAHSDKSSDFVPLIRVRRFLDVGLKQCQQPP